MERGFSKEKMINWQDRYAFKVGDKVEFITDIPMMCETGNLDKFQTSPYVIKYQTSITKLCENRNGEKLFMMPCDETTWHKLKDVRRIQ